MRNLGEHMMKSKRLLVLCALAFLGSGCGAVRGLLPGGGGPTTSAKVAAAPTLAAPVMPAAADAADATPKVVAAAEAFLATLDDTQRAKVQFEFSNAAQRANWSNFPTGIYQRAGLRMGDLSQAQQDAAMAVVAATLSQRGYQHVVDQVEGDEVLKTSDGGGGNLIFGKAEYYISFLGKPSSSTIWTWQFGGHHLAINATIAGKEITLAPSLTGGQPAQFQQNGQTVRTIGEDIDAAFKFVNALDAAQQKKAVIGTAFTELALGPGADGKVTQPEGIKGSDLNADQQALLLDVIHQRVNLLNDEDTAGQMAKIKAALADTYFAWSGPTTAGSAAYYRVQGPTMIIEFSPQSMGGDAMNHIHAMLRDPSNDYGAAWAKP
jgi:hypothetical protein